MRMSEDGLALVRVFEGFREMAYLCPAKVWTIGYGHTKGVKKGDWCDEATAEAWLREDVGWAERAVRDLVKVPLAQHEFDALVSFTFNVGRGALQSSSLLRLLNGGLREEVPKQLARWNKAGGKVLEGLRRRRAAESALWRGEDWRKVVI